MTTQKDRIEAAIRHIQTSVDIDPWAMELAVDALKAQGTCEDAVSRRAAIDRAVSIPMFGRDVKMVAVSEIKNLPSAQPEEVIPHRNYKYLSDYWCTCGWHLGKKGEVKYCADCGRKVNWDE